MWAAACADTPGYQAAQRAVGCSALIFQFLYLYNTCAFLHTNKQRLELSGIVPVRRRFISALMSISCGCSLALFFSGWIASLLFMLLHYAPCTGTDLRLTYCVLAAS